ncbi:MLP-like protein 423 [Linum perenne]
MMNTDIIEVHLNSSVNDVWSAIAAATAVYPKAMPNLYKQLDGLYGRDGNTVGSMRTITFGPLFNGIVKTATEKIEDVDHEKFTVYSTFMEDGGLVPTLFESLDITLTLVVGLTSRNIKGPGCTVRCEFAHKGSNGKANIDSFKNVMMQGFKDLDGYLRHLRGIRPWP